MQNPDLDRCMHNARTTLLLGLGVFLAALAPVKLAANGLDLEELGSSLRKAEEAFAASVEQGDIEAFASFVADDAVFSGSGGSLVGKPAIVQAWSAFFQPGGPRISWHPTTVVVHPGGKLGTSQGPYRLEQPGKGGELEVASGTFFSVWQHTEQGWKVILDGGTEALPEKAAKAWAGDFAGMEWLEGHWTGEGLGGWIEEAWTAPAAGAMIGLFRLVRDGKPSFYELFTLHRSDEQLVLQLKHFEPDMKGWEEKDETVDFPLVSRGEGKLEFEGLRYSRDGEDGLRVEIDFQRKQGLETEVVLLRRSSP